MLDPLRERITTESTRVNVSSRKNRGRIRTRSTANVRTFERATNTEADVARRRSVKFESIEFRELTFSRAFSIQLSCAKAHFLLSLVLVFRISIVFIFIYFFKSIS